MKQNLKIFLLFCLIVLPLNAYAQATAKQAAPKQKISFKDLSLEDKLAQTIVVSTDIDNAARFKNAIQQGLVGGVLIQWGNYSLKQTKELIDKLQGWAASSPKKIPLLISIDYEGGTVYTPVTLGFPYLPTNMALAAAQDIEDTTTLFYIVGKALRKLGVQINFAPVIDVNINPANPIIGVRSFGSDTKTVSQMGVALINGLQKAGVVAVAKHFPGHGETTLDSHKDLPHLNSTEAEFRATHLPPFEAAIKNNVKGVMTAHIVYDFLDKNNPATFSPAILNGLLRKELGFKGIIISDSLDMKGATKGANIITAAEKSLASGVDMVLTSKRDPALTHSQLLNKINVTIPQKRIEEAAEKIFKLKQDLGLFEDGGATSQIPSSLEAFNYFANKLTREAVTVVKAQSGVLPYTKYPPASLANTQNNKEEKPKLCSVFFSPSRFADQLQIIQAPFLEKGWEVEFYNAYMRPRDTDITRAKRCMQKADLVIIGSMQWADKPIASQKRAIAELLKSNKDIVFVSLMSPYDIKFYPEAKNVIALYGINHMSSQAAADVILGNIEPKGKLPIKL